MGNNIAIVGAGYVGLVTGACLAEFGMNVVCMDIDEIKIEKLKDLEMPIYEPGLEETVRKNMKSGRLRFTSKLCEVVEFAEIIFIAVNTPPNEDGSSDLKYVFAAAKEIAKYMRSYHVIVNKSTVPVGTAKKVKKIIQQELDKNERNIEFDVVSNPEFLREGTAIKDFMNPDRIVIGADSKRSKDIMKEIYNVLYLINRPFVITNSETAELIKYASNAFLATKISFINEIANICEEVNADINHVAKALGMDKRIGDYFLHAGPGFGGSCFPKDTRALANIASECGQKMKIVEAVINANNEQKLRMVKKVKKVLGEICGKTIAVLGVSFKPETDDIRESPAIYLIRELYKGGAKIKIFDPIAMENTKRYLYDINIVYCKDEYDACTDADSVVFMTEWNQFRNIDIDQIKVKMNKQIVFDFRNIFEPDTIKERGFIYEGVGRR